MIYRKVISVISVVLLALLPISCYTEHQIELKRWKDCIDRIIHYKSQPIGKGQIVVRSLSELDSLERIGNTLPISRCYLSGKGLEEMPDFSKHEIHCLDLSYNMIKGKLDASRLPKGLVELDIQYNEFEGEAVIPADSFPELRAIWCAVNKLTMIDFPTTCRTIHAAENKLKEVRLNYPANGKFNLFFLNLSTNWELSNKVCFDPSKIKCISLFGTKYELESLVRADGADCP